MLNNLIAFSKVFKLSRGASLFIFIKQQREIKW